VKEEEMRLRDGAGERRRMRAFRLRAVLFDFDGTLTLPGALDFAAIKRRVGCPPERFVLEYVEGLTGEERKGARAALELFELEGAAGSRPNEGAEELLRRLRARGLKVGVLTRNGRAAVLRALREFADLAEDDFDAVVTRDDGVAPKPAPDGVLHAAELMGVRPQEVLMVGDYVLDVRAGAAAGAVTVYLTNGGPGQDDGEAGGDEEAARTADFVVHGLAELEQVVRLGSPLPAGKLPNELLGRHLAAGVPEGQGVLLGPRVGEDVAAMNVAAEDVLVAHGDPITLASRDIGRYAVLVNANDIATSGADPRWLLTTVLLPAGTTGAEALALLDDIGAAASEQGIAVVGGHTEVSPVVDRPLVAATMLGVVRRAGLRDKRAARPGDLVLLTKGLAVEGTALLAEELRGRLLDLGLGDAELEDCRALLGSISIVAEARATRAFAGVRALHDVTEGGLATAVRELSAATGCGLEVDLDAVPVLPQTRRLCELLRADPLGLIGSGSLLVAVDPTEAEAAARAIRGVGVAVGVVGRLIERGAGVAALSRGLPAPLPVFEVDEAARLLAGEGG
jgi:HAD superfamily hydrolase (TIGR01509 family)